MFNYLKSVWKERWNIILSIILFSVVTLNVAIHILWEDGDFAEIIWFCDIMSYVLAFALWFKNRFLISTVFLSAVPTQFLWIVDFFLQIFGFGLGRTEWLFTDFDTILTPVVSTIMHAILIPSALYGIYKLGFHKKSIIGIYITTVSILLVSYLFTDPTLNRNCAFFPCDLNFVEHKDIILNNPFYMTHWYLIKEIFTWFMYGTAFYLFVLYILKFDFFKSRFCK